MLKNFHIVDSADTKYQHLLDLFKPIDPINIIAISYDIMKNDRTVDGVRFRTNDKKIMTDRICCDYIYNFQVHSKKATISFNALDVDIDEFIQVPIYLLPFTCIHIDGDVSCDVVILRMRHRVPGIFSYTISNGRRLLVSGGKIGYQIVATETNNSLCKTETNNSLWNFVMKWFNTINRNSSSYIELTEKKNN
jgi:hypothetical protein